MAIKKAYQELIAFLEKEDVQKKTVRAILPKLREMCESSRRASTQEVHKVGGEIVAAKCAYHGLWFLAHHFGIKPTAASGINPMTKDGAAKTNKQKNNYNSAKSELLMNTAENPDEAKNLKRKLAALDKKLHAVVPMDEEVGQGFETLEELLEAVEETGGESSGEKASEEKPAKKKKGKKDKKKKDEDGETGDDLFE